MSSTINVCVFEGTEDNTLVIRISGRSAPIVVTPLGIERDANGSPVKIYLNSLIFNASKKDAKYEGWVPSGCVSTILTRIPS